MSHTVRTTYLLPTKCPSKSSTNARIKPMEPSHHHGPAILKLSHQQNKGKKTTLLLKEVALLQDTLRAAKNSPPPFFFVFESDLQQLLFGYFLMEILRFYNTLSQLYSDVFVVPTPPSACSRDFFGKLVEKMHLLKTTIPLLRSRKYSQTT